MKLWLDGGLGDSIAATAVVREYKRAYPEEMIRVEGVVHKDVWEHNPHLRHGNRDNGKTVFVELHKNEMLGAIPHSFARQISLATGVDFQITNDTPEIFLTPEERRAAHYRLAEGLGLSEAQIIGALPFPKIAIVDSHAMWPTRQYPVAAWKVVLGMLHEQGWVTIQVGSVGPDSYGNMPEPMGARHDWLGKTTVREAAALMHRADLFLGNDSGGFHLAAAVGCPQVVPFGIKRWYSRAYWNTTPVFPYGECLPACFDLCERTGGHRGERCLTTIPPWRVAEAAYWAVQRYGRH